MERIREVAGPAEFKVDRTVVHRALDASAEILGRHAWGYCEQIFSNWNFTVAGHLRFGLAVEHHGTVAVE